MATYEMKKKRTNTAAGLASAAANASKKITASGAKAVAKASTKASKMARAASNASAGVVGKNATAAKTGITRAQSAGKRATNNAWVIPASKNGGRNEVHTTKRVTSSYKTPTSVRSIGEQGRDGKKTVYAYGKKKKTY